MVSVACVLGGAGGEEQGVLVNNDKIEILN